MDEFVYTAKIKDSMNFVYPSRTEQKANFIYTKLSEMPAVALEKFLNMNTYTSIQVNKRAIYS